MVAAVVTATREGGGMPLVVFLHGASARGNSFENHRRMSLVAEVGACETSGALPVSAAGGGGVLLLSPLCPCGTEWKKTPLWQQVLALIEDITANTQCAVDRRRVYLTGVSMGGLGTWMLASRDPSRFAALVPICGGGSPVFAPLVKHVPCWFFHSSEDNVIGVEETDALVQAMQREEAVDVRYTRYGECPDPAAHTWMVGHNSWTRSYAQPALWAWLLLQSLPPAPAS